MGRRCCCGCCELSTGTNVAAVICLIECVCGLFWNTLLLILLNGSRIPDILAQYVSLEALTGDNAVVHGLTLASVGLHIVWVIFAIMLIRANATLNRGLLTPWVFLTYFFTLFDIGSTIYFAVKFQGSFMESDIFFDSRGRATRCLTYLVLMLLFSRGFLTWFLDVYLAHVVERRGKEIDHNNSVLALYIVSQLSRAAASKEQGQSPEEPPPAYYSPGYLPSYLQRQDSTRERGSSWSINQEALHLGFSNPLYYPHLAHQVSVTDVQPQARRPPPAYGGSRSIEQSISTSTEGVLPY